MKQQEEEKYVNLIYNFEDYVGLYNLIIKDLCLIKLQMIVDSIHNTRFHSKNSKEIRYPTVLLHGKESLKTTAIALLRSVGMETIKVVQAGLYGGASSSIIHFQDCNEGIVLCNIEELQADKQTQNIILNIIKTGKFSLYNYFEKKEETHDYNGMLVLTCHDLSKVHEQIYKSVSHVVQLIPLHSTELELIVRQRLVFSGIEVEDDDVVKRIVKEGRDMRGVIRFLQECVMMMKANGNMGFLDHSDLNMTKHLE